MSRIIKSGKMLTRPHKIAIWFEGEQEFDLLPFIFFVSSANAGNRVFSSIFQIPQTA
jgi:hypothetical protein